MAWPVNQIGNFVFLSIEGFPIPPRQEVEVHSRRGVRGSTIARTGVRGMPFQVVTSVDSYNRDSAWLQFRHYQALIGQDPVEFIKNNVSSLAENYGVCVLHVEPLVVAALLNSTPAYFPPSLGWLRCRWDLIGIPLDQQN